MEGDRATERNASMDLGGQDKEEEAARGGVSHPLPPSAPFVPISSRIQVTESNSPIVC